LLLLPFFFFFSWLFPWARLIECKQQKRAAKYAQFLIITSLFALGKESISSFISLHFRKVIMQKRFLFIIAFRVCFIVMLLCFFAQLHHASTSSSSITMMGATSEQRSFLLTCLAIDGIVCVVICIIYCCIIIIVVVVIVVRVLFHHVHVAQEP